MGPGDTLALLVNAFCIDTECLFNIFIRLVAASQVGQQTAKLLVGIVFRQKVATFDETCDDWQTVTWGRPFTADYDLYFDRENAGVGGTKTKLADSSASLIDSTRS